MKTLLVFVFGLIILTVFAAAQTKDCKALYDAVRAKVEELVEDIEDEAEIAKITNEAILQYQKDNPECTVNAALGIPDIRGMTGGK